MVHKCTVHTSILVVIAVSFSAQWTMYNILQNRIINIFLIILGHYDETKNTILNDFDKLNRTKATSR